MFWFALRITQACSFKRLDEAKRVTKRTVKFRIERFLLINRENNKYISI